MLKNKLLILKRETSSSTYQNATMIVLKSSKSYMLATCLSNFSEDTTTLFAQVIGLDAYNHKQVSYMDALTMGTCSIRRIHAGRARI